MSNAQHIDRTYLTETAYADSRKLAARIDIYHYQQPALDFAAWALAQIDWHGIERVLDVGCGSGQYLQRLLHRPSLSGRVFGLDLSYGMLHELRSKWEHAFPAPPLAVADIQALPLPDHFCDAGLAMHMLYYAPNIPRAVAELRRVLRPGGVLLATTLSERHLEELFHTYSQAVNVVAGTPVLLPQRTSSRFILENGAALLQSAFDDVKRHEVQSMLFIPDPAPIIDYLESGRQLHEAVLPKGVTWDAVIAELTRSLAATIAQQGAFRATIHSGVFVCH